MISMPTGSGKTVVIASLCAWAVERGLRPIVLAHRKELLSQDAGMIARGLPGVEVGIYSAGLGRRDMGTPVLVAGIQSIARRGQVPYDLAIIDEAHLVPNAEESQYRGFLGLNQQIHQVVGLTATPYRLGGGLLYEGDNSLFTALGYECDIHGLIRDGWLSSITNKCTGTAKDFSKMKKVRGEFQGSALDNYFESHADQFLVDMLGRVDGRQHILLFTPSINVCEVYAEKLANLTGDPVEYVHSGIGSDARASVVRRFRDGEIRWLLNVNVLTTGFDAPKTDCLVLFRATCSPGLYVQIVGRGMRVAPGKPGCLVLDYGGNIERHGPIDRVSVSNRTGQGQGDAPMKICPGCQLYTATATRICPDCGHEFEFEAKELSPVADTSSVILSTRRRIDVFSVGACVWTKRGGSPGHPKTVRVAYHTYDHSCPRVNQWLCPEHDGWPRTLFCRWWSRHMSMEPPPATAEEAAKAIFSAVPDVGSIEVEVGGRWPEVKRVYREKRR